MFAAWRAEALDVVRVLLRYPFLEMKVLLIYPPQSPCAIAPSNFEPLALEVLASTIPNHEVTVFDMRFETLSALEHVIQARDFDLAGISVNNTIQVNPAKNLLQRIRTWDPRMVLVVGGHHPTVHPVDFYETYVDAIFTGWAEKSFPQFVSLWQEGIQPKNLPGVLLIINGRPASNGNSASGLNQSDIPHPDRSVAARYTKNYRDEFGRRTALVNTARGCPFRCSFCSCWRFSSGRYMVRKAGEVFREIAEIPDFVGRVFFADDNTFQDLHRAEILYQLIRDSGIKKKYSGYCRADTIVKKPELFRKWQSIGLDNLTVGFEAISEENLKRLNKSGHTETNRQAVALLNEAGLKYRAYFLIDPVFQKKDFAEISQYIEKLNIPRPMFVVLTPLPGTELYEIKKPAIDRSYDYFDFVHWVEPPCMGEEEFYRQFRKIYYRAYSLKRYLRAILRDALGILGMKQKATSWPHVSLPELIKLRVIAWLISRRLHRFAVSQKPPS